jgi:hypothetical protein
MQLQSLHHCFLSYFWHLATRNPETRSKIRTVACVPEFAFWLNCSCRLVVYTLHQTGRVLLTTVTLFTYPCQERDPLSCYSCMCVHLKCRIYSMGLNTIQRCCFLRKIYLHGSLKSWQLYDSVNFSRLAVRRPVNTRAFLVRHSWKIDRKTKCKPGIEVQNISRVSVACHDWLIDRSSL